MALASIRMHLEALLPPSAPYSDGDRATIDFLQDLLQGTTDITSCDKAVFLAKSLAPGATETIDLKTQVDSRGVALALVDLHAICFICPAAPGFDRGTVLPNRVAIGPDAANGFAGALTPWQDPTDRTNLMPKGTMCFIYPAGYTVDNTHKVIDLVSAAAATVYVLIIGRSA